MNDNNEKDELLCKEHGKKIEAFCFDDNTNLCVSCLIESNHKTHNFISIEKAQEKFNEIYSYNKQNFNNQEQIIKDFIDTFKANLDNFKEQYYINYKSIIEFFDNLIEEINIKKEKELKKFTEIYNQFNIETYQKIIGSLLIKNEINKILIKQPINFTELRKEILKFESIKTQIKQLDFTIPNIKIPLITNNKKYEILQEIINIYEKINLQYQEQKPKIKRENKSQNYIGRNNQSQYSKLNSITVTYINTSKLNNKSFIEQKSLTKKNSLTNISTKYTFNFTQNQRSKSPFLTKTRKKTELNFLKKESPSISPREESIIYKSTSESSKGISIHNSFIRSQSSFLSNYSQFDLSKITEQNSSLFNSFFDKLTFIIYIIGGKSDYSTIKFNPDLKSYDLIDNIKINKSDFVTLNYKDNKYIILGGKINNIITNKIEYLNLSKNSISLNQLNFNLPFPISSFGAFYFSEKIFICGGDNGKNILNSLKYYDQKLKNWIPLQKMNKCRKEFSYIQTLNNCFYVIGGQDENGNILNSVEKYDIIKNKWEKISNMNLNRKGSCALYLPNFIYVIGGFDGVQYLKSCEKYEFKSKKWNFIQDMNFQRSFAKAVLSSDLNYIYVFGGYCGFPLNNIERYDIFNDKWENFASLPKGRYKHDCVIIK